MEILQIPGEIPEAIKNRLRTARSAVVFSGAGVSRESGLDTFRCGRRRDMGEAIAESPEEQRCRAAG